jgi:hypothetical protein
MKNVFWENEILYYGDEESEDAMLARRQTGFERQTAGIRL